MCSASRELAEGLLVFPVKCTLRLARDGKGAQQAGRAVLLSASTRLECLTVLPEAPRGAYTPCSPRSSGTGWSSHARRTHWCGMLRLGVGQGARDGGP